MITNNLNVFRASLLAALHKGECIVEFTKVNGELRVMPCTLAPALLPAAPVKPEGTVLKERKENLDTIRVFCTDKKEWRSFRVDSVISIKESV